MEQLIKLIGREIIFSYKSKGRENAIKGMLRSITDTKIKVGGIWVELPEVYEVEEIQYTGS